MQNLYLKLVAVAFLSNINLDLHTTVLFLSCGFPLEMIFDRVSNTVRSSVQSVLFLSYFFVLFCFSLRVKQSAQSDLVQKRHSPCAYKILIAFGSKLREILY